MAFGFVPKATLGFPRAVSASLGQSTASRRFLVSSELAVAISVSPGDIQGSIWLSRVLEGSLGASRGLPSVLRPSKTFLNISKDF